MDRAGSARDIYIRLFPMNKLGLAVMVLLLVSSPQRGTRLTPRVDLHQHFFSPETAALATGFKPLDAADLVKLLDNASISRALVLSVVLAQIACVPDFPKLLMRRHPHKH